MGVRTETEVLDGLTGVLWSTEEKSVASGWSTESKLVEGQALTTGGNNASTGSGGEAEGSNAELWDGQKTVVVGDGTDDDHGLVVGLLRDVGCNAGEGDRWAVDARHKEAAENNLVEGRLSATCGHVRIALPIFYDTRAVKLTSQEAVKLHQQSKVDIVALWRLAVRVADVVGVQIDTCRLESSAYDQACSAYIKSCDIEWYYRGDSKRALHLHAIAATDENSRVSVWIDR